MKLGIEQAKRSFFDRDKIRNAMDRATRRNLSKLGAFIRTRARSSIRKRKKASEPGKPPSSHEGTLKKLLFFVWDSANKSVVVGPAKTNQVFFGGDGQPVKGTVPELLEEGGEISILEWFRRGQWYRADLRQRRRIKEENIPTRMRKVKIDARPYMKPAYETETKRAADLWKDALPKLIAA